MVFTRCASSELELGALREVVARKRQGVLSILSRKAWKGAAALYRVSELDRRSLTILGDGEGVC